MVAPGVPQSASQQDAEVPHPDRERDHLYRMLVENVTDYALYMLDREGRVATWNAGARRFKGYTAEEIIGEHFSRFYTEEDRAKGLPQHALTTAAAEGRFEAEGWRVRKDGSRFWANAIVDPIYDDEGQLTGFAKITRDITDRKDAEAALYQSEQQFRMLVQGVRDYAIYMLDPEGRVTNWNAGAEAIKGYSADEIIGEHFSRFYPEADRQAGEPQRTLNIALENGHYDDEVQRVRKDGTVFWAQVHVEPIRDEAGRLAGFAKVTRDVSDRRSTEQQLEEARAALFQAQKLQALGELTGGIAHDFNNLMTVIRGSAELLQRENVADEKRRRYLAAIVETADRASTLTGHLLAFGRRQPLKPEVLDLNVRLDAFGEMLARTLGSQIEIILEPGPGLWQVEVDPAQLETALLNAAVNARDAMPEGGTLTISTANVPGGPGEPGGGGGDFVQIAIADTGTGMPEEVVARAFEPFFTTKPVGKGTGLGLSQIHGFAAQTGGRAEIDTGAGKGTTLRLYMPRSGKELSVAEAAKAAVRLPDGLRVLAVEDNAHVRGFAEHLLEELHCRAVSVGSAEEAVPALEQSSFDILFSDVVMPGMSGIDLARLARKRFPGVKILLASGYSEEIIEGAAGEFEVLMKPYGAQTLAAALLRAR